MLHYLEGRAERIVGMVYLDPTAPRDLGRETVGAATESQFEALLELEAAGMAGMSLSDGLLAEFEALDQFRSTAPALRGFPADPQIPTAVVLGRLPSSGGPGFPDFVDEDYWRAAMNRRVSHMGAWVASMARGTLYFTTEAGHNVHIGARELSLQAVRRVWDAAVAR